MRALIVFLFVFFLFAVGPAAVTATACVVPRVLEAGAAVVFASDLNSMKNVRKLT